MARDGVSVGRIHAVDSQCVKVSMWSELLKRMVFLRDDES